MKKVLLTATVQSHICQFHRPLVEMLHSHGYEVHAAARNNLAEKNGLSIDFVDRVFDLPFSRSPKSPDNIRAYRQLKKILAENEYEVIHCNTPMGGIVTRLAARKVRKKGTRIFYTAHGFHFYKGAPKRNWVLFYPIERLMAHLCSKVITINMEDYRSVREKFSCPVAHIHGVGADENRYHSYSSEAVARMKENVQLADCPFIILCIGELNQNKNQKVLLDAAAILKAEKRSFHVLLAGNGPEEDALREQMERLHLTDVVTLLGYRTDLENITPMTDLVVSCSFREGLGINLIEAMLCKKPVLGSTNRGHKELIAEGKNGFLFEADHAGELADRIGWIMDHGEERERMGAVGQRIAKRYTFQVIGKELEVIYDLQTDGEERC